MADLGHPHAAQYRRMRRFYDRLAYASNSSARRYTWVGDDEHAEYWAPRLEISFHPTGLPGYWHVFPAHQDWTRYIESAAAAGWPEGVRPGLSAGTWYVTTRRSALLDALAALQDEAKAAGGSCSVDKAQAQIRLGHGAPALDLHGHVLRLLRLHQRDGILPRRRPGQDDIDLCPLPLSEKRCVLSNVDRVTVADRHVLIPLIPFGPRSQDIVVAAVRDLIALVRNGLPFEEPAHWLESVMIPEAFARLARSHRTGNTTSTAGDGLKERGRTRETADGRRADNPAARGAASIFETRHENASRRAPRKVIAMIWISISSL